MNKAQQGVSGSGKSTLGIALAKALGYPFLDADDLHPQTNIDQMSRGEPLTDADRAPWLVNVRRRALEVAESNLQDGKTGVVVACSALKVRHRDVLRGKRVELDQFEVDTSQAGSGDGDTYLEGKQISPSPSAWRTFFVHPFGPHEVLLERLMARTSHFMKANMLASQVEALENPLETGESDIVTIGLGESVEEQVQRAVEGLKDVCSRQGRGNTWNAERCE